MEHAFLRYPKPTSAPRRVVWSLAEYFHLSNTKNYLALTHAFHL